MPEVNIDFSDVQDDPIANGWHSAAIFAVEPKQSSNDNAMLSVQVKIVGGPWNNRTIYDNWMLETDALFRTKSTLKRLGLMSKEDKKVSFDTQDLIGMEVEIKTRLEEFEGEERAKIRQYRIPTGDTIEAVTD